MKEALDYSQIYLVPQKGVLESRKDAVLSTLFNHKSFKLPVVPANMKGSISPELALQLDAAGYFYIMHRFGDTLAFVRQAQSARVVSISVGVQDKDRDLIEHILNEGLRVDFVTVDIAHGHSKMMQRMLDFITKIYTASKTRKPCIIAGNVTTPEGCNELAQWGADAVKIGIGGGGVCSTKNKTGFHVPMATCIMDCKHFSLPIIADGGIRDDGDIAKALALGADMVMAGGLFAACVDSPAEGIDEFGRVAKFQPGVKITHKRFFGSASAENKGERKHVEGFTVELPCNGLTYAEKLREIEENLSSAVSYSGGKHVNELKYVSIVKKA